MQYTHTLTGEQIHGDLISNLPAEVKTHINAIEGGAVTGKLSHRPDKLSEWGFSVYVAPPAPEPEPEPIPDTVINSAVNLQTEIGRVNATYGLTLGVGSGYDETLAQLLNNESISEITRVLEYDRLTNRYNEYAYHYQRWHGGGDPWEGLADVAEALQNQ
jgi:hypothetical protein